MRKLVFCALFVSATGTSLAQQSAYQDADSNTSVYLMKGNGNLTYNVSDSKFRVALVRIPDGNYVKGEGTAAWIKEKVVAGINFSGKPTTDLTNQIFQTGNSPATVGGGGVVGIHGLGHKSASLANFPGTDTTVATATVRTPPAGPPQLEVWEFKDDWFLVNLAFTKSTFNTVAASSTDVVPQHFNGFSVLPTYNAAFAIPKFNFIFGASGGVSRVNNADRLKKVTVSTVQQQSGNVSIVSSKDAYQGTYAEAYNLPIYSDFIFIPKGFEWLSFDAFERANVLNTDGFAEGGFGIFIAQPKNATKVLGGISVGWKDGDRSIGIVGGWTF